MVMMLIYANNANDMQINSNKKYSSLELLSYRVNGILFWAHNELGRYAKEKQYGNFIETKLKQENIKYKREYIISDTGNTIDFMIENKIVLELKNTRIITKHDYFQIQRYLQTTGLKLGIIVNFRSQFLRPKRIIKTNKAFHHKYLNDTD